MGPEVVVVVEVRAEDAAEVLLIKHDDVVGALAPERADYPLNHGVRLRRSHGRLDSLDPDLRRPKRKVPPMAAVTISEEEPWRSPPGRRPDDLSPDPGCRGMSRHVEVHDPPSVAGDDDEDIERSESQRGHREEVRRPDLVSVEAKECTPAGRWWSTQSLGGDSSAPLRRLRRDPGHEARPRSELHPSVGSPRRYAWSGPGPRSGHAAVRALDVGSSRSSTAARRCGAS